MQFVFAVIIAVLAETKAQGNFFFSYNPDSQAVVEGSEVTLRCDVSNRRSIVFHWEIEGKMIKNTSRRYQEDSDLHILRVDRQLDSGGFLCIALNTTTGGTKASQEARLDVLWIDQTTSVELAKPRDQSELSAGSDVILRCQCEGNEQPEVHWYKNKIRLFQTDQIRLMKNRLKLMSVTPEDNGVYSCEANNKAGIASSDGLFILSILGAGVPRLNTQTFTSEVLLPLGGTAVFDCEFVGADRQKWFYGNLELTNRPGNKYLVAVNGSLIVRDVQPSDQGAYTCVAIGGNSPQSYVAELELASLGDLSKTSFEPKLPDDDFPVVIPERGDYQLKCLPPPGNPPPTVKWLDPQKLEISPSGETSEDGRHQISSQNGTLIIKKALSSTDSGSYSCVVENMAGTRTIAVPIEISVDPIITQAPKSEDVLEGSSVQFQCSVRGTRYPVTRITWTKDGEPIVPQGSQRIDVDEATGLITISQVQDIDEGNYACIANTEKQQPKVSLGAYLYVKKILKFIPHEPEDRALQLNSRSEVPCYADGQPAPSVRWEREGFSNLGAGVEDYDGVLTFDPVTWEHAGNYTCIAVSSQGRISHTVAVRIAIWPKFTVRPHNTTAAEGEAGMLHCVAQGQPVPHLEWRRSGQKETLDPNRFQTLPNGTLYISSLKVADTGRYTCLAGNIGTIISEEVYLIVGVDQPSEQEKRMVGNFDMMKTIIIAVCAAVAYLAIVIGLTVYCSIRLVRIKHAKSKRGEGSSGGKHENGSVVGERQGLMGGNGEYLLDCRSDKALSSTRGGGSDPLYDSLLMQPTGSIYNEDNRSHASGMSSSLHGSHQSSNGSGSVWMKYSYPRSNLQSIGMLGKGIYGDVFLAKAPHIKNGQTDTLVCVKSLQSKEQSHNFEFRRELEMYARARHENVVQLLGVCCETEPHFLIMEYLEWGDLKQFLWASRKENHHALQMSLPPLTISQKVSMCHQVACGMEHLANQRLVHKDLAARNVFLSPTLHLKIASPALCRDIYVDDYFNWHQRIIPLRWMPPEAIRDSEYSQRSDVWAFGCFALEVFTLGEVPHAGRSHEDILRSLEDHSRTSPCSGAYAARVDCPQVCWTVIQKCTMHSTKDRPNFTEICTAIGDMTVDSDI